MAQDPVVKAVQKKLGALGYKSGTGGFQVFRTAFGIVIQYLDPSGVPRKPRGTYRKGLLKLFPKLDGWLRFRSAETMRRNEMLDDRLYGKATEYKVTLDSERPLPTAQDLKNTSKAAILPRNYATVDFLDKQAKTARLCLWGSELSVAQGTRRLDEAVVVIEITETELKKLKAGTTVAKLLQGKRIKNLQVVYLDDNQRLTRPERLNHVAKSAETTAAWLEDIGAKLGFKIDGQVQIMFDDIVRDPLVAVVDPKTGTAKEMIRPTPSSGQFVDETGRVAMCATFDVDKKTSAKPKLKLVSSNISDAMLLGKSFGAAEKALLQANGKVLIKRLETVLKAML
jgi:hypothetical protein